MWGGTKDSYAFRVDTGVDRFHKGSVYPYVTNRTYLPLVIRIINEYRHLVVGLQTYE